MNRQKLTFPIRGTSPCDGCTERFLACHDNCPKDNRGQYGYKAFKAEIERVKANRKKYLSNLPKEK